MGEGLEGESPPAVGAGLEGEQLGVEPAGGHELAVGAAFSEAAVEDGDGPAMRTVEKRCEMSTVMPPSSRPARAAEDA